MMLITNASYFLNTQLTRTLNHYNFNYLVAVDDFPNRPFPPDTLLLDQLLGQPSLPDWLEEHAPELECMFHVGRTKERGSEELFQRLWKVGVDDQIPFIFQTTPSRTAWIHQQPAAPFFWAGLSFDVAFGPGDEGWVPQAVQALPRGLSPEQTPQEMRSMVYSQNITNVCYWLLRHRTQSGIFSLDPPLAIDYRQVEAWVKQSLGDQLISAPDSSPPHDLQEIGFDLPYFTTESGVTDYVKNHFRGDLSY